MQTVATADLKLAARFRTWAEALTLKIEDKMRPMSQAFTPKRGREYQARVIDGRNLERLQKALRALAYSHSNGTISSPLASLRTKEEISAMVRKHGNSASYYNIVEADDYSDKSDTARLLQAMIDGNPAEKAERDRLLKIQEKENEIKLTSISGFFPTPSAVIDVMLSYAGIEDDMRVLEPSAGSGNIADAIRQRWPLTELYVCEINLRLQEILKLKGHTVATYDFLELEQDSGFNQYDRIVMNPPFEKMADQDHVRKAYVHLAENGRLVSVMSPSFEFRSDRKSTEFRAWLESIGAHWENLPDGSFKSSGTGVSTRLLVIDK